MNPSYFTEEHQLFREFKRFFTKVEVRPIMKMGTIELHMEKFGEMGFFGINYRRYMVV
jgi:hypothetical protein